MLQPTQHLQLQPLVLQQSESPHWLQRQQLQQQRKQQRQKWQELQQQQKQQLQPQPSRPGAGRFGASGSLSKVDRRQRSLLASLQQCQ